MPIGKKTPKSELHEFYQLHPGNPSFAITSMSNPPAEPLFSCTLICPAIGGNQGPGLAEQSFTGQGRNKKAAEQYAAEKALSFLRQQGLMAPALVEMDAQQLPPDLQRQLAGNSKDTTSVRTLDVPARPVLLCTASDAHNHFAAYCCCMTTDQSLLPGLGK